MPNSLDETLRKPTKMNDQIQLDKPLPLPEKRKLKYPFQTMKVGDTFLTHRTKAQATASAAQSVGRRQKASGYPVFKFVQRAEPGTEMTRFWRSE